MPKKSEAPQATPEQVGEALSASVLQEMVHALEDAKLGLLLNIKELKDKLAQQKEDQADIYYYLNKKCDESFEVIGSLEEQLLKEQDDRQVQEEMYEHKIRDLKELAKTQDKELHNRIEVLNDKLERMNAFVKEKDSLERRLKELEEVIEEQKLESKREIERLESKHLLEKEKTRKAYDHKFEVIRKELELTVDSKLSKKTKKTQIMNLLMKKELDDQVGTCCCCCFMCV
jgi:hypothetical protein